MIYRITNCHAMGRLPRTVHRLHRWIYISHRRMCQSLPPDRPSGKWPRCLPPSWPQQKITGLKAAKPFSPTLLSCKLLINELWPEQNGWHIADDISRCIFLDKNHCSLIKFSLKLLPMGTINNKSALVQVMAWCLFSTKPLPEPMLTMFYDTIWCQ